MVRQEGSQKEREEGQHDQARLGSVQLARHDETSFSDDVHGRFVIIVEIVLASLPGKIPAKRNVVSPKNGGISGAFHEV